MEIKKGQAVRPAGPTQNETPTKDPRACFSLYTFAPSAVNRGGLAHNP